MCLKSQSADKLQKRIIHQNISPGNYHWNYNSDTLSFLFKPLQFILISRAGRFHQPPAYLQESSSDLESLTGYPVTVRIMVTRVTYPVVLATIQLTASLSDLSLGLWSRSTKGWLKKSSNSILVSGSRFNNRSNKSLQSLDIRTPNGI